MGRLRDITVTIFLVTGRLSGPVFTVQNSQNLTKTVPLLPFSPYRAVIYQPDEPQGLKVLRFNLSGC